MAVNPTARARRESPSTLRGVALSDTIAEMRGKVVFRISITVISVARSSPSLMLLPTPLRISAADRSTSFVARTNVNCMHCIRGSTGVLDGKLVGFSVGRNVGAEVGFVVGFLVGTTVGWFVGKAVGLSVGDMVGRLVGGDVGTETANGVCVGIIVAGVFVGGKDVGTSGITVGAKVLATGAIDGLKVGDEVGISVVRIGIRSMAWLT